jgi:hypothetical protein
MISLKPGQLCMINNTLYRAKKRENGCNGCALDNITCPNIADSRNGEQLLNCSIDNIILKRV